jgi:hypothetical protein
MSATSVRPNRPARTLLHVVVVALGWIGFAWMWVLVARRPWESHYLIWLIAGSTVALPLLTFAWVLHNRFLFRRKGERRAIPVAEAAYTRDWHGRSVEADWSALRCSEHIVVSVADGRKLYRSVEPVAPMLRGLRSSVVAAGERARRSVAAAPAADAEVAPETHQD